MENQVCDVEAMPLERLEAEITELAAHRYAATCRWLQLVAVFDRREGYGRWECRSTAHWLNWHCGVSLVAAREHVRVGRALESLPILTEAFGAGTISYSKVRAIVRIATPATEATLVEWAPYATAAQIERICRSKAKVDRHEAGERAPLAINFFEDDDGTVVATLRLDPEETAAFKAALTLGKDRLRSAEHPELEEQGDSAASPGSSRITNVDAFCLMVETMLASDPHPVIDRHERTMVMLHIDAEGNGHLHDGSAVNPETAKRISCDAPACAVTHAGSEILNLGRTTRVPSRAQRRALLARDGGCRFPGCIERRYVQAHHVIHWIDLGPTDLDNLVLLCWRHHHAMHEGGYSMAITAGAVTVWRADGSLLQSEALLVPRGAGIVEQNGALGLHITAKDVASKWEGPRWCDYGMAIDALLGLEARAASRPAAG